MDIVHLNTRVEWRQPRLATWLVVIVGFLLVAALWWAQDFYRLAFWPRYQLERDDGPPRDRLIVFSLAAFVLLVLMVVLTYCFYAFGWYWHSWAAGMIPALFFYTGLTAIRIGL